MAFVQHGPSRKFPRNDHVDIVVRALTLNPNTAEAKNYVEIREFLKNGNIYGHGIVIPHEQAFDLATALQKVVSLVEEDK